jgi:hypothetical protein
MTAKSGPNPLVARVLCYPPIVKVSKQINDSLSFEAVKLAIKCNDPNHRYIF